MRHPIALAVSCLVVGVVSGCGPSAPPARVSPPAVQAAAAHSDHHTSPASLAEGVTKLESLAAELATTMSDEAVHGIGHLLEEVRELAKKSGIPDAATTAVTAALDELEECFGKVDEAFHSGDEKADPKQVLASVKDRVDAALKAIKEVL